MTTCDRHTGRPAVLPRRRLVEQASLDAPATRSEVAGDLLDSARKSITTGLYGFISPVESFDTDASTSFEQITDDFNLLEYSPKIRDSPAKAKYLATSPTSLKAM